MLIRDPSRAIVDTVADGQQAVPPLQKSVLQPTCYENQTGMFELSRIACG
jgi:hypothetical protein